MNKYAAASALSAVGLLGLAGCADPGAAAPAASSNSESKSTITYNTSPDQDRIRSTKDPKLADAVPDKIKKDGKLTVATTAGSVPLSFHATDEKTVIGTEVDLAQLVADKLGLELDLQITSWENWPLKTESGDFEAVFSNVGVNADRVKKFDFASYRAAYMGFEARADSNISVKSADDISGKKIAVGSGTNQEKILLTWNKELEGKGKAPAELQYYSSEADTILALSSGRIDLNIAPYPSTAYRQNQRDDLKVVGKINAGWPNETLVAATTRAGNHLAEQITAALNETIEEGTYAKVLDRWSLSEEGLTKSETINASNYKGK
ncbi:ABC transporter substrate-binding protein [Glutamicibacter halophytocola]|uniref:ABC transporter substrate-binding protein n=1 Tax=Glutamicibacter halophytocola TaxID=1933880 RepID=UPI001559590E|nr:ABC transporter substrate-binding protein [Glutamicibacter halophytocola]NQD42486.1 ABC transporter substrate-binding protein [Glutamicibacter halophytocola]